MSAAKKTQASDPETLGETNYRAVAQKCIAKYGDKGMLADLLLWGQIVGHYERELEAAATALKRDLALLERIGAHLGPGTLSREVALTALDTRAASAKAEGRS